VHIILHNCRTQDSTNSSDYLPSYPPDKHQSSDAVYWRGGGMLAIYVLEETDTITCFCIFLYLDEMINGSVCHWKPSVCYETKALSCLSHLYSQQFITLWCLTYRTTYSLHTTLKTLLNWLKIEIRLIAALTLTYNLDFQFQASYSHDPHRYKKLKFLRISWFKNR